MINTVKGEVQNDVNVWKEQTFEHIYKGMVGQANGTASTNA